MTAGLPSSLPPTGGISEPDFARLPDPETLFAHRARRMRTLGETSPLGPYLAFLAHLVDAQSSVARRLQPAPAGDRAQRRLQHAMPAFAKQDLGADGFPAALDCLLDHGPAPDAPEQARAAWGALHAMPAPDRLLLAEAVWDGSYPVDALGEALYVAAALQVHLAVKASALLAGTLRPVAEGLCPVCGSAPVVSLVVGWAKADHARYCCCGLCGTQWNHVRIKCTCCGSTEGIGYLQIEGQHDALAAETCGQCRSYIKHLHQHKAPELEPLADDIASLGLDLLVQAEGFRRATANPLMVTAGRDPAA